MMRVLLPQDQATADLKGHVVAIGNFDGLHRGHQELLHIAASEAQRLGCGWGVLTFEPHPRSYFKPADPVFRLTPQPLKERLLKALGASFTATITFDEKTANSSPEDFVRRELVDRLGVSHVVTGYDFHFGKGRRGSPETLKQLGAQLGFGVTRVEQVTDDDSDGRSPFSSSSIRTALARGHVDNAARELGYRWIVMGEVVHGDKRGRTIGFPTANIVLEPGAEPFRGIYAVAVRDAGLPGAEAWWGAGYFGDRPTFNTNRTFLEVYLLDRDIDLYGRTLMVEFHEMIRGDKTFKSVDELIGQMRADCDAARVVLARHKESDPLAAFPLGEKQRAGLL
ncbi:MAG: bifunctional riboflavin kinase/FAD synthetase [Proteobacteria bacterium]|nr:bifunctional riboflavin kinase/FAD synthetase [Pseudomonadota bacterium]